MSSILSGSCDHLENGTREWILVMRTRHRIPPNTKNLFWSKRRMNTVPNIDMCRAKNSKAWWTSMSSLLQQLQDHVVQPVIHMIPPAMLKNTKCLTMCLRQHPDVVIAQQAYWLQSGSMWIHRLKHQWTGGELVQISMITTQTEWRAAVHFGYWT